MHRTGKLGFTQDAAKKLKLPTNRSADIGFNEEDQSDKNLYLFVHHDDKKGEFKIIKAGLYYYLNTKVLFDNLKIDYRKEPVSFDISPEEIGGETVYILKRRMKMKKEKNDFDDDES